VISNNKRIQSAGFTLIELMIVVTLGVMMMLAASSLFVTFLVANSKVQSIRLVKNEGEQALSQMEFLLRNSVELVDNPAGQLCETGMESISFKSIDGGITTLGMEEDGGDEEAEKIASNSGVYLTSSTVEISDDLTFNCSQSSDGLRRYVEIVFSLRKGTPGVDLERDIIEEEFRTGVALRN
jgi:prepilin-type N-terminal cleavage/methylation domain-containing protein